MNYRIFMYPALWNPQSLIACIIYVTPQECSLMVLLDNYAHVPFLYYRIYGSTEVHSSQLLFF